MSELDFILDIFFRGSAQAVLERVVAKPFTMGFEQRSYSSLIIDTVRPLLPNDKLQQLTQLRQEFSDKSVTKSPGFFLRHASELLWPRSLLQAAGIFAVVSGASSTLAGAVCVGLTVLGVVAALLSSAVLTLLVIGACVGWGAFLAALFVSFASAIATLCGIGATLFLVSIHVSLEATKRATRYLLRPKTKKPADLDMKSARSSSTPLTAAEELARLTPRESEDLKRHEDAESVTDDLIASSNGDKPSALTRADRSGLTTAELHDAYNKGHLSAATPSSSAGTSPVPGLRTLSTYTESDAGSHKGSVQSAPTGNVHASRRSNKKSRGKTKKTTIPPDDVMQLLDAGFQGEI